MKKFLIVFLSFFIFSAVKAYTGDTMIIKNDVLNIFYYYNDGLNIYSGNVSKIFVNGNMAYKLDVKVGVNTTSYSSGDAYDVDEDILLFAYFGYGYLNNNNFDYYLATQQLIWEELGYNVQFYSAINGGGTLKCYDKYKDEIKGHVEKYKNGIEIQENMNYILNSTNKINIDNGNEYRLINNSENTIILGNDSISLKSDKIGLYSFSLIKEYINKGYNQTYTAKNSSSILFVGRIEPTEHFFNYEVNSGTLAIINDYKYAEECYKNNRYSFSVYDDKNNIIKSVDANYNEKRIVVDGLGEGKYTLKRSINGEYADEYSFFINNDIKDEIIVLDDKLSKSKLNLHKGYKNTKMGMVFDDFYSSLKIIDSNKLVVSEIKPDSNGWTNLELYCGKYSVLNEDGFGNAIDIYSLNENDFIKSETINYNTIYLKSKLRIYVNNYDGTLVKNIDVLLENKEYNTGNLGYIETDYLDFKEYNVYVNDIKYSFLVQEDSEFYIDGKDTYVNYYINFNNIYDNLDIQQEKNEDLKQTEVLPNLYMFFNGFTL